MTPSRAQETPQTRPPKALPFAPITRLLDKPRPGVRLNPPRLGEHNAKILAELGYSAIEIEALYAGWS